MNILFIIGNGFDLNLGLKTGYKDFYKHYSAIPSNSPSVNKLKSEINGNYINWSDLELGFGQYTKNLENQEEFDEVHDDLIDSLAEYLTTQENTLEIHNFDKDKLITDLQNPQDSLLDSDKDKLNWVFQGQVSDYRISIMTFNYTNTFEALCDFKSQPIRLGVNRHGKNNILQAIYHVHGYQNNRMVLGVNDISQISNEKFQKNIDILETLVKSDCNRAGKHNTEIHCQKLVNSAGLICIFGSSIGETDNCWWDLVGQRIKSGAKLIIFHKTQSSISARKINKTARIEREVRNNFLAKIEASDEDKEKMKNNIFVGVNTNLFNIKAIN